MSRAQQGQIESTETGNSATSTAAATKSQEQQQGDINEGTSQLAKFAADNPYVQGGAAQVASNQTISGAADASAEGAKAGAQSQAERTGQNPAAANAAAITAAQNAQRTASAEQGSATTSRLASETGYGKDVMEQGNVLTNEQAALTGNLTGEAQGQEGVAEDAAKTPSFLDELGSGLIQGGEMAGAAAAKGCWIAAELYDGWDDPRVSLIRAYLFGSFSESRIGAWLTHLYVLYGIRAAEIIRRNRTARFAFKMIFDRALSAAKKWKAGA